MPYIKKLVMEGFKSFAQRTEIIFDRHMNIIVGPNGSGKSNIIDALCFVLGRLSIKSLRASKAANLIFAGSKVRKPAQQAIVELVFDNRDKAFPLDSHEVKITRIVKRNGQSIYKINDKPKTRQEVLELLSHIGIDPYGFNLVLQNEISRLVEMHPEERRAIIEEIAGIRVYEKRKEKSLRELEKTEEKLREINAILRERYAYLKNLEEERAQALRYKKLERFARRLRASILKKKIAEQEQELERIERSMTEKEEKINKINSQLEDLRNKAMEIDTKISEINQHIQTSAGVEQEKLHHEISELRAEIAALIVKRENYENQIEEANRRKEEIEKNIESLQEEIHALRSEDKRNLALSLEEKTRELSELEEKRKELYSIRAEFSSLAQQINSKKQELERSETTTNTVFSEIENLEKQLHERADPEELGAVIETLKQEISTTRNFIEKKKDKRILVEQEIAVLKNEKKKAEEIKKKISELDICPLCKSKITEEHAKKVIKECERDLSRIAKRHEELFVEREKLRDEIEKLSHNLRRKEIILSEKQKAREISAILREKRKILKQLLEEKDKLSRELEKLITRQKFLRGKIENLRGIEEKYEMLKLEVDELSREEERDIETELKLKKRELERMKLIVKQLSRDVDKLETELQEIEGQLEERQEEAAVKEKQEKALYERFQKMFATRSKLQQELSEIEKQQLSLQHKLREIEDSLNELRIERAQVDAKLESLREEAREFIDIPPHELVKASLKVLEEKLANTKAALERVGTVNMKALEVYEKVKHEYDVIWEKAEKVQKEKEEILNAIAEIDRKKKRTFIKTLKKINELFSRNFMQLSTKGIAYLELENKEEPFSGGLEIVIKVGKGKYFHTSSLSGGERVLVALSLIFAIQEYRPYCFYVFDEVDAALDKRNSERLAALMKKYMKTGQYIIITHNDAVISEATVLYGVTMHDGVSKVVSLQL